MNASTDEPYRARIPADIDTPDKIAYGLTARQLAVLAVAAVLGYGLYTALIRVLPAPVAAGILLLPAGLALALALGRRDGLGLDSWLWAGLRYLRHPKLRVAPPATGGISDDGVIDTGTHTIALVAGTTVNIGLRTADEQAALIGGYGRWLNSLSAPVQIVVSTRRVDLSSQAQRVGDNAAAITAPGLAALARDYAAFLAELAEDRDPLWRTITVAHTATQPADALRRAEHTAGALATLGAETVVLDGGAALAVLTCAVDPYTPAGTGWPRAVTP
ncbi:PrgI family protein [Actinoplanes sp. HUAS TT8]|uniref:PrgI family protein n=1 Tax=Actinoplanes sp. HUAS TT8 TaxID=3447453 RepID=UPI003F521196